MGTGPLKLTRLRRSARGDPLQPGDVVRLRNGRRVVITSAQGDRAEGYALVQQNAPRHRAELRLASQYTGALGLPAQSWLIKCTDPVPVQGGAPPISLGRLPLDQVRAMRLTAARAATADLAELGQSLVPLRGHWRATR